jgi:hypothetical protein
MSVMAGFPEPAAITRFLKRQRPEEIAKHGIIAAERGR